MWGQLPDITLKRARERCQEARRLGVDGSAERKAQKAATEDTFEAIAREYFEMKREGMTPKTYGKRMTPPSPIPHEFGELLRAIHSYRGHPVTEGALKLAPLRASCALLNGPT